MTTGADTPATGRRGAGGFLAPFVSAVVCALTLYPFLVPLVLRYDSPGTEILDAYFRNKGGALERRPPGKGRLIFVGGSGGHYSLDGELVEQSTGIPTVNACAHAGLALRYPLARLERDLVPGDTVVAAFEFAPWGWPEEKATDVEWKFFTTFDKRYWLEIPLHLALRSLWTVPTEDLKRSPALLAARAAGVRCLLYDPSTLGPNGDLRLPFQPAPFELIPVHLPERPEGGSFSVFASFARRARARGIRVAVTWAGAAVDAGLETVFSPVVPPAVRAFFDGLGVTVLDEPRDLVYPRAFFQDCGFHMNSGGRRVRTEALVDRLRPFLGLPAATREGAFVVTGGSRPLSDLTAFAGRTVPRPLLLVPEGTPPHPSAATAAQLVTRAAAGESVTFDDPLVEATLLPLGYRGEKLTWREESLAAFLRAFPDHVVLAASSGVPLWRFGAVPAGFEPLREALDGNLSLAALVGTGSFAGVTRSVRGEGEATLEGNLERFVPRWRGPRLAVRLRSERDGDGGLIELNGRTVVAPLRGLGVAVLDPLTASLVATELFPIEAPAAVRRLYRAVPLEADASRPLDLGAFTRLGATQPIFERSPAGALAVTFTGTNSMVGIAVGRPPAEVALLLDVEVPVGTEVEAVVQTNAPDRFLDRPAPRRLAPGRTTVALPIRSRPGTHLAEGEWAAAGLVGQAAGSRVLLHAAATVDLAPARPGDRR